MKFNLTKLKFLFIGIVIFCLFNQNIRASYENRTPHEKLHGSLEKLHNLDRKFIFVKVQGEHTLNFLYKNYRSRFFNDRYLKESIGEILRQHRISLPVTPLDFEKILLLTNLFSDYSKDEDVFTISIDGEGEFRILQRSLYYYGIGLLFHLDSLKKKDLKNTIQINGLIDLVLNRLEANSKYAIDRSLYPWEYVSFYLFYANYANYPIDLVYSSIQKAMIIAQGQTSEKYEKAAAATLVTQLAMFCYTNCRQMRMNSEWSKDQLLKQLFKSAERVREISMAGYETQAFYTSYLDLLEKTNDPERDDLKSDLMRRHMYENSLNALENFLNIFRHDIPFHFFKDSIESLFNTFVLFVGYIIFGLPTWIFIFSCGFLLLTLSKPNNFSPKKFVSRNKTSKITVKIYTLLWSSISYFSVNTYELFRIFFLNFKHSYTKGGNIYYQIGASFIVISGTLGLSYIKSYADKLIRSF